MDNQTGGKKETVILNASKIIYDTNKITSKNHKSTLDTMYQIA